MTEDKKTTYLILHEDGTKRKVTVPSTWKVTFGPIARTSSAPRPNGYQQKMPIALRFYEAETKQRAVFTDVVSFRDMSIIIEEEVVDVQQKHGKIELEGGGSKAVTANVQTKQWLNPDDDTDTEDRTEANLIALDSFTVDT